MKKTINKRENLVLEMCNGIVLANPELEFLRKDKIIKKKNINKNKVNLISGGIGYESTYSNFVGRGMLDAVVLGDEFNSPSQIQIYNSIKEIKNNKGTLLIIKNHKKDTMNFKNAIHLAIEDGFMVEYVKVEDDITVEDCIYPLGKRGIAGTVLVYKIAGAASELGMSLYKVKEVAQKACDNIKSLGFVPSNLSFKGKSVFNVEEDEIEFGIGIQGEPGIRNERIVSIDDLVKTAVNDILGELSLLDECKEVAIMVNGFGLTPIQELYLLNNFVVRELSNRNIKIYKSFVGNYMTSLDRVGASISIMKLDNELKYLLCQVSEAPGFKVFGSFSPMEYTEVFEEHEIENMDLDACFELETSKEFSKIEEYRINLQNIIYIIDKMSEIIIQNEIEFCELDSYVNNGDFGKNLAKGFKQLKKNWNKIISLDNLTIGKFLNECSMIIMEHCGGLTGPIWGSAFRSAGRFVGDKKSLTILNFANMMDAIVNAVQATGERAFGIGAGVGDKTLIDALVPCANSWELSVKENDTFKEAFEKAAKKAVKGAESTKKMKMKIMSSEIIDEKSLGHVDPGAYALGLIFTKIANDLELK